MIDQFDRLRRRNAFVEQYKKEKIFSDSLEEFDDARYVSIFLLLSARSRDAMDADGRGCRC